MGGSKVTLAVIAVAVSVLAIGAVSAVSDGGPVQYAVSAVQDDGQGTAERLVIKAIAREFSVSEDELAALHREGVGLGALFQLAALSYAQGVSISEIVALAATEDGEYEFSFEDLFANLSDEQRDALRDRAPNMGELVSRLSRAGGFAGMQQEDGGNGDNGLDGDNDNGDGSDNANGNGPGTGHDACSQATQHALDVLNGLAERGEPVDEAIDAVTNCGTGRDKENGDVEDAEEDNGGPPEGVEPGGPPSWVPGPPPHAGQDGDDDVEGSEQVEGAQEGSADASEGAGHGPPRGVPQGPPEGAGRR